MIARMKTLMIPLVLAAMPAIVLIAEAAPRARI